MSAVATVNRLLRQLEQTNDDHFWSLLPNLRSAMIAEIAGLYSIAMVDEQQLLAHLQRSGQVVVELDQLMHGAEPWLQALRLGSHAPQDISLSAVLPSQTQIHNQAQSFVAAYRQLAIEC